MKMLIYAEKTKSGKYRMVGILQGKKEYPQEGYEHGTPGNVLDDVKLMYSAPTWKLEKTSDGYSIEVD